jgi:hypothetical protein
MVVPVETGIDISVSSISLINVCLSHALRFVFEQTEVVCEETVSRIDRFFLRRSAIFPTTSFRSQAVKKYVKNKKKEALEAIGAIFLLLLSKFNNTEVFILKIDTRLIRYDVMYSSRAQQTKQIFVGKGQRFF